MHNYRLAIGSDFRHATKQPVDSNLVICICRTGNIKWQWRACVNAAWVAGWKSEPKVTPWHMQIARGSGQLKNTQK